MVYPTKATSADQFIEEINTNKHNGGYTSQLDSEMKTAWDVLKATLPEGEREADEVKVRAAFAVDVPGLQNPVINAPYAGVVFVGPYVTKAGNADQFADEITNAKRNGSFTESMSTEMNKAWEVLKATLPENDRLAGEVKVQAAFAANVPGTSSRLSPVVLPVKTIKEFTANVKLSNTFSDSAWELLKFSLPVEQQASAENTLQAFLTNKVPNVVRIY